MSKVLLLICAQVLLVKIANSQCINALNDISPQYVSYPNARYGLDLLSPATTLSNDYLYTLPYTGSDVIYSNLETVSSSPLQPGFISVVADNLVIDGYVSVTGSMPLFGSVAVDGTVPTNGQASLVYNAGNGISFGESGCGIGPIIAGSGTVVTNPGIVSNPVLSSNQVVTSGPVVTGSYQRVVNNGCGY